MQGAAPVLSGEKHSSREHLLEEIPRIQIQSLPFLFLFWFGFGGFFFLCVFVVVDVFGFLSSPLPPVLVF